jgi:RNA polymerase sigma factor (sigma-70 family)
MDTLEYNKCVDAHADALFRFVVHRLRDRDEAHDIVQESFLRLWMKVDQVEPEKGRPYLFSTAINLIIDRSRRRKYVARYEPSCDDVLTVLQPAAGVKEEIRSALEKLSPRLRHLVILRDVEGYSYKEIADMTDLEMTQVKVYLFRARKFLQRVIGDPAMVV